MGQPIQESQHQDTVPPAALDAVLTELGVEIDAELFTLAMTHRSYSYEHGGLPTNERLEFLGDSVLGVIVTDHLYLSHPDLSEGRLAKLRAAVVNARALAGVARSLGLGDHILLGRGEQVTGGSDKSSILADTTEAVIGAVYLAHGIDGAGRLVHHLFDPLMADAAQRGAGLDWKTSVQELLALRSQSAGRYLIEESGPDHEKFFTAWLVVDGARYGPGTGRSKKEAEQQAAEVAFQALSALDPPAAPEPLVAG